MKHLSVKARVTLFYSVILIVVVLLAVGVVFLTVDFQVENSSARELEQTVKDAAEDISFYDDRIEIDPDFDFYKNGVTLVLYGEKGTPLAGTLPQGFPQTMPLVSEEQQTAGTGDTSWTVYNLYLKHPNTSGIWIRGIYSMHNSVQMMRLVRRTVWIGLPALTLVAILGGYLITRRAFRPLTKICEETRQISSGNDLSRRLEVPKSKGEFKVLTETLNDMLSRLEQSFENERQFSADVSHELRTPTAIILSQCEDSLRGEKTGEEYRAAVVSIQKQGKRMASLIAQLLELSRSADAQNLLEKEPIPLAELCESVAEELAPQAAKKNISITTDLDQSVVMEADQVQIIRLLTNLVSNAIRYGKSTIRLELRRVGEEAEIAVSDDGIGISEENLPKVFRRFYKGDTARGHEDGGSFGLGLSYVDWIARIHGGRAQVESTLGKGTIFRVFLPALPAEGAGENNG